MAPEKQLLCNIAPLQLPVVVAPALSVLDVVGASGEVKYASSAYLLQPEQA